MIRRLTSTAKPVRLMAMVVLAAAVAVALFPGLAAPWDPAVCSITRSLAPPSFPFHPFGYDIQGCDLFGLTLVGTQASMLVGIGATLISAGAALVIGVMTGVIGGVFDEIVSRVVDVVTAVPVILVGLVVLTAVERRGPLLVILVLSVAAWPIHTGIVRSVAIRTSREPFVDAARALGASRSRVVFRHVLPHTVGALLAVLPTTVAFSIGVEAVLTFLGAGLQLPAVSWGVLLGEAQIHLARAPHLLLPGLAIVVVSAALFVIGGSWHQRTRGGESAGRRPFTPVVQASPEARDSAVTVVDPDIASTSRTSDYSPYR